MSACIRRRDCAGIICVYIFIVVIHLFNNKKSKRLMENYKFIQTKSMRKLPGAKKQRRN